MCQTGTGLIQADKFILIATRLTSVGPAPEDNKEAPECDPDLIQPVFPGSSIINNNKGKLASIDCWAIFEAGQVITALHVQSSSKPLRSPELGCPN